MPTLLTTTVATWLLASAVKKYKNVIFINLNNLLSKYNMHSSKIYRRHDISDKVWEKLAPLLAGRKGALGHPAKDNRRFINAVFWIFRTGAPWRDLPPDYGDWKNTHRRFSRWRDKGRWENILEALVDEPDFEWLMLNATHIKVPSHGAGTQSENQATGPTKRGSIPNYIWPWMRMVCRSEQLLRKLPCQIVQRLVQRQ